MDFDAEDLLEDLFFDNIIEQKDFVNNDINIFKYLIIEQDITNINIDGVEFDDLKLAVEHLYNIKNYKKIEITKYNNYNEIINNIYNEIMSNKFTYDETNTIIDILIDDFIYKTNVDVDNKFFNDKKSAIILLDSYFNEFNKNNYEQAKNFTMDIHKIDENISFFTISEKYRYIINKSFLVFENLFNDNAIIELHDYLNNKNEMKLTFNDDIITNIDDLKNYLKLIIVNDFYYNISFYLNNGYELPKDTYEIYKFIEENDILTIFNRFSNDFEMFDVCLDGFFRKSEITENQINDTNIKTLNKIGPFNKIDNIFRK